MMQVDSPVGRVHLLSLGRVQVRPPNVAGRGRPMLWWTFTARTWTDPLPVHAFVVEHDAGPVLFDTGQAPESSRRDYFPGGLVGAVYRRQVRAAVPPGEDLASQLAAAGVSADELACAIVSHLHYDHAGNVERLGAVPVLVSEAEYALFDATSPEQHGVLVEHVRPAGVAYRPVGWTASTDPALADFEGAFDIHGDGSLVLLPTPGHSVGSMSLLVRAPGRPPLLMVGDVTYDSDLLFAGVVPDVGDRRVQRETAARITALAQRLPGLTVLPAHDPRTAERLAAAWPS